MLANKAQYSVLIVTGTEKGTSFISEMLDPIIYNPVISVKSAGEARRLLITNTFDLVVINAPLTDEFGYEFALTVAEKNDVGIILIVKNEMFDEISYRVEEYGILTVSKPLSKPFFHQVLKLLSATSEKLKIFKNENIRLQTKLEELRIVERAKWALIQYLNMSETQAHRYIEKQAMDMRISKKSVAENIIKTYES